MWPAGRLGIALTQVRREIRGGGRPRAGSADAPIQKGNVARTKGCVGALGLMKSIS
jgi:hypothetical protein